MSQPDSKSTKPAGVLVHKPRTTIYTALLGVTAVALAIGCALLVLELSSYELFGPPWDAAAR